MATRKMLSNGGVVVVGSFASDPSNMPNGSMYYNTTSNTFRKYENGAWGAASGSGDVSGPGSSTDNAIARFDATTGKVIQDSIVTVSDLGAIGGAKSLSLSDLTVSRVLVSDGSKNVTSSSVTSTTLAFLDATSSIQTQLNAKEATANKGVANGYASLDSNALIPITQIPPAALERLVIVANQAARFALTTTTVQNGDTVKQTDTNIMYFVSDDTNLGNAGGYTTYTAGTASSVAWSGVTGTPTTLTGYGITDYAAAAKAAAVADAIVDGVTDVAPSQNAVFDALALKLSAVSGDAAPSLGGNLNLNSKVVLGNLQRAAVASPTSFVEEEYAHALTLTGSQTNTVQSTLTFAHASFEGIEVTYKIKEATTNKVRIGKLRVVTNGTDIGISDDFTDSADCDVSWDAAINGANCEIKYTTANANNKTMRADIKRFKV